jgi:protein-tyrosine phosphatase
MAADRTLVAEGFHNARDLGGLPLVGGGTTPRGRVFRSERPELLTDAGWSALHDAGIRTIVDLRRDDERAEDTNPRPDWVTTVSVDLDDMADEAFWSRFPGGLIGTPIYYGPHLAAKPERTGQALRHIARAAPGGVLFHCAGGRDRTGIVSLALLTIAGVRPEAIVDDYLETVACAPALMAAVGLPSQEAAIEELCAEYGTTVADTFRAAVAGFDVDRFVAGSGLDASDLEALRTFRAPVA